MCGSIHLRLVWSVLWDQGAKRLGAFGTFFGRFMCGCKYSHESQLINHYKKPPGRPAGAKTKTLKRRRRPRKKKFAGFPAKFTVVVMASFLFINGGGDGGLTTKTTAPSGRTGGWQCVGQQLLSWRLWRILMMLQRRTTTATTTRRRRRAMAACEEEQGDDGSPASMPSLEQLPPLMASSSDPMIWMHPASSNSEKLYLA